MILYTKAVQQIYLRHINNKKHAFQRWVDWHQINKQKDSENDLDFRKKYGADLQADSIARQNVLDDENRVRLSICGIKMAKIAE